MTRLEYLETLHRELKRYAFGERPMEIGGNIREKLAKLLAKRLKLQPDALEIGSEVDRAKREGYDLLFDILRGMLGSAKEDCCPVEHLEDIDLHDEDPLELNTFEVLLGERRTITLVEIAIEYVRSRKDEIGGKETPLPSKIE